MGVETLVVWFGEKVQARAVELWLIGSMAVDKVYQVVSEDTDGDDFLDRSTASSACGQIHYFAAETEFTEGVPEPEIAKSIVEQRNESIGHLLVAHD